MSNLNYNNVTLGGRLTGDPEIKTTNSGNNMAVFNLAVNRRDQSEPKTDFFRCIAWGKTAEFISQYFRKGSGILIDGSIQTGSYTDQQGVKRNTTDIAVGRAFFVDSKAEAHTSMAAATPVVTASEIRQAPKNYIQPDNYTPSTYGGTADIPPSVVDIADSDALPF